jgi:hypothetical protein
MCAMSVTSSPDDRQGIWDPEDPDWEEWDPGDPQIYLAGGNRQDNELLKWGRRVVRRLKRAWKR